MSALDTGACRAPDTPAPPREYHFPRFERRRLENGLELIVAQVTKLPIVTVVVLVDAGAVCDPSGAEGAAQLVAKLMLEGTQTSDGAELTERFERLGATIDAQADWDAAAFTMTALAERLPDAFALLGEVLRTPAFRPREVDAIEGRAHRRTAATTRRAARPCRRAVRPVPVRPQLAICTSGGRRRAKRGGDRTRTHF